MRCMSSAVGSSTAASRCNRMPTWRCSRTACCAAMTDFGRPSVIGSTSPGNSTVLRTGTMMSASGGNGGSAPPPCDAPSFARISSATIRTHFLQRNHETAVGIGAAHPAIAPGRQRQPPEKASLGQLKAVDGSGTPLLRHDARPGDDEIAVLDHGLYIRTVDAGERDQ